MKKIIENFGFITVATIAIFILIALADPMGRLVKTNINSTIGSLGGIITNQFDKVPKPSTLGYKPKDTILLDNRKYVVLKDRGSNDYLLMDIDGIGRREFNTDNNGQDPNKCKYDTATGAWNVDTCNNQYENSDIDEYLNKVYYESLPESIKSAIDDIIIQQNYYKCSYNNPNYKWVREGDTNYNGCNNTTCVLQSDSRWIPWNEHIPVKGNNGMYEFDNIGDKNSSGTKSNVIKRRVYLPSINDVSSIININDEFDMDGFLRDFTGNRIHMWFRDAHSTNNADAMYGLYNFRSLNGNLVRSKNNVIRPCFVINLEAVQHTKLDRTFPH